MPSPGARHLFPQRHQLIAPYSSVCSNVRWQRLGGLSQCTFTLLLPLFHLLHWRQVISAGSSSSMFSEGTVDRGCEIGRGHWWCSLSGKPKVLIYCLPTSVLGLCLFACFFSHFFANLFFLICQLSLVVIVNLSLCLHNACLCRRCCSACHCLLSLSASHC